MTLPEKITLHRVAPYVFQLGLLTLLIVLVVRWVEGNASTFSVIRVIEMRSPLIWVWPLLLASAVIGLVAALWRAEVSSPSNRGWIQFTQIGIASGCLLGVCILPELVRPFNDLDKPQIWSLAGPAAKLYTSSVYFGHDSAAPDATDIRRLRIRAGQLSSCRVLSVEVNGLASSAEYRKDNEKRNLGLASRRVDAVKQAVGLGAAPNVVPWTSLKEMSDSSSFYADRINGIRQRDREPLNRRVDVIWKVENCGIDLKEPLVR